MTSSINRALPTDGDKSNPAPEIRANFDAAADELDALHFRFWDLGPVVDYTAPGDDSGTVPLTGTYIQITSHDAGDDDDLDLPDGTRHGHDLVIELTDRVDGSDTITILPVSANIVNAAGTAVTSVVLDAEDELLHVKWDAIAALWRVQPATTGTVAT